MSNFHTHSSIKRWDIKHRIFLTSGSDNNGREPTHRLLDGGNLHIPKNLENLFFTKYAADMFMGKVNYLLEVKSPIYQLLVDLDIYENNEIEYEELREWILEIQKVVKDMYPDLSAHQRRVVVCTTETSPNTLKNGKVYVKQGLGHLIWPDIQINNAQGLAFRKCCIQKLEKKFGLRHADNIWEDVIDDTLYKANGLRMIGSSKLSICKNCKRRKKNDPTNHFCEVCLGAGKFNEGRVYKIQEIIDGDLNIMNERLELLQKKMVKMVKETSIRSRKKHPTKQTLPKWFDSFHYEFDKDEKNVRRKKEQFYNQSQGTLTKEDREGSLLHNINEKYKISTDSKVFKTIRKLINRKMPDIYKNTKIMDIHLCNSGVNDYYLIRMNTSFCMNVARYHNSNTIYFVVTEYGICQKCFCNCKSLEGRKYKVYCKDFRSGIRPISTRTKKILFSDTATNTKKLLPPDQVSQKNKINDFLKKLEIQIQIRQDFVDGKHTYEKRFNSKRKNDITEIVEI